MSSSSEGGAAAAGGSNNNPLTGFASSSSSSSPESKTEENTASNHFSNSSNENDNNNNNNKSLENSSSAPTNSQQLLKRKATVTSLTAFKRDVSFHEGEVETPTMILAPTASELGASPWTKKASLVKTKDVFNSSRRGAVGDLESIRDIVESQQVERFLKKGNYNGIDGLFLAAQLPTVFANEVQDMKDEKEQEKEEEKKEKKNEKSSFSASSASASASAVVPVVTTTDSSSKEKQHQKEQERQQQQQEQQETEEEETCPESLQAKRVRLSLSRSASDTSCPSNFSYSFFHGGLHFTACGYLFQWHPLSLLARIMMLVAAWACLWILLPHGISELGGMIFDPFLCFMMCSLIGTGIGRAVGVPPLIVIFLAGLMWGNIPEYEFLTAGISGYTRLVVTRVGLANILLRTGLAISPKTLAPAKWNIIAMSIFPMLCEILVHGFMAQSLFDYEEDGKQLWPFLQAMVVAPSASGVVAAVVMIIQQEGYTQKRGPGVLLIPACAMDMTLGIWGVNFMQTLLSRVTTGDSSGSLAWPILQGPVQIIVGGIAGVALGFVWYGCMLLCFSEGERLPFTGRYASSFVEKVSFMSTMLLGLFALLAILVGYHVSAGGGGCIACTMLGATASYLCMKPTEEEIEQVADKHLKEQQEEEEKLKKEREQTEESGKSLVQPKESTLVDEGGRKKENKLLQLSQDVAQSIVADEEEVESAAGGVDNNKRNTSPTSTTSSSSSSSSSSSFQQANNNKNDQTRRTSAERLSVLPSFRPHRVVSSRSPLSSASPASASASPFFTSASNNNNNNNKENPHHDHHPQLSEQELENYSMAAEQRYIKLQLVKNFALSWDLLVMPALFSFSGSALNVIKMFDPATVGVAIGTIYVGWLARSLVTALCSWSFPMTMSEWIICSLTLGGKAFAQAALGGAGKQILAGKQGGNVTAAETRYANYVADTGALSIIFVSPIVVLLLSNVGPYLWLKDEEWEQKKKEDEEEEEKEKQKQKQQQEEEVKKKEGEKEQAVEKQKDEGEEEEMKKVN